MCIECAVGSDMRRKNVCEINYFYFERAHHRRMLPSSQMHLTPSYWRSMQIISHPMAQRKMIMYVWFYVESFKEYYSP